MDGPAFPWLALLLVSAAAGPLLVALGNLLLRSITWGNPRALVDLLRVLRVLVSVPPTTTFRWRPGVGLQALRYDEDTEVASGIWPDREGPGLVFWMWGERPRSAAFVAGRVRLDLAVRVFCFVAMFLGSFVLSVRLAVTEDPRWLLGTVFLAVHQLAVGATGRYVQWEVWSWHSAVLAGCVFAYLQGGVAETVAVWVATAHFVVSTLATWYVMSSRRMREVYRRRQRLGS